MLVSTRQELQSLLDNIRITQGTADGSPLAYRVAWVVLVLAPVIGLWIVPQLEGPYSGFSLFILLSFFVQALYTIIQYKVNRRLRPILEALLFVPETPSKEAALIPDKRKKPTHARPTRGRKR